MEGAEALFDCARHRRVSSDTLSPVGKLGVSFGGHSGAAEDQDLGSAGRRCHGRVHSGQAGVDLDRAHQSPARPMPGSSAKWARSMRRGRSYVDRFGGKTFLCRYSPYLGRHCCRLCTTVSWTSGFRRLTGVRTTPIWSGCLTSSCSAPASPIPNPLKPQCAKAWPSVGSRFQHYRLLRFSVFPSSASNRYSRAISVSSRQAIQNDLQVPRLWRHQLPARAGPPARVACCSPTGAYRCTGCRIVFSCVRSWWEAGVAREFRASTLSGSTARAPQIAPIALSLDVYAFRCWRGA